MEASGAHSASPGEHGVEGPHPQSEWAGFPSSTVWKLTRVTPVGSQSGQLAHTRVRELTAPTVSQLAAEPDDPDFSPTDDARHARHARQHIDGGDGGGRGSGTLHPGLEDDTKVTKVTAHAGVSSSSPSLSPSGDDGHSQTASEAAGFAWTMVASAGGVIRARVLRRCNGEPEFPQRVGERNVLEAHGDALAQRRRWDEDVCPCHPMDELCDRADLLVAHVEVDPVLGLWSLQKDREWGAVAIAQMVAGALENLDAGAITGVWADGVACAEGLCHEHPVARSESDQAEANDEETRSSQQGTGRLFIPTWRLLRYLGVCPAPDWHCADCASFARSSDCGAPDRHSPAGSPLLWAFSR